MTEVTKLVVPTPSTSIPDWDPNCKAAYGIQSYWLVYAALWWSSHDRTLFVTASKKVPPFDAFSDRDENELRRWTITKTLILLLPCMESLASR